MRWDRKTYETFLASATAWMLLAASAGLALAEGIRTERVSFSAGASSATMKGAIQGDEVVDYVLGAKAGQRMSVAMKTSNASSYFNVLPPDSEAAIFIGSTSGSEWSAPLPADGDYRVRVYLMRNAARRGEKADYTLSISITAGAAKE